MRKKKINLTDAEPFMVSMATESIASTSTTSTRRNIAGTIERTQRFQNIDDGLVPFKNSSSIYGSGYSSVDVRDAIILCQKCYYNFAVFRNVIDLMTEFSVNNIFFKGGNKQSRDFFTAFWKKIGLWGLQDRFFREYYRSGNVFFYRWDGEIQPDDIRKITQVYGADKVPSVPEEKMILPIRYIILNPADVQMVPTANFAFGTYFKVLTDFELSRIAKPQTEEDLAIFNSLPEQTKQQIKSGSRSVSIPLSSDKVASIFYKKQDYEPFSVPMGYPVLEDINFKAELRKIDMAICRTMQQIVLLVTTGAEPEKGGINQKNIDALRRLFENQSVGRVLIADYTTKAEFVIPQIADLLDPKKYEIVDRDINMGLNNIFMGGEKFANQQQKVELFIARLKQARNSFLEEFLIPEMKRISKSIGFKNFPTPYFEEIELKDNSTLSKIFARMVEIGVLTPEQGFKAIETNTLPDPGIMEEEQKAYKEQRDKGLYTPLIGGPKDPNAAGRPEGAKAPQTTKKITPIGGSVQYSLSKVRDNLLLSQELEGNVASFIREKFKLKKLSKQQKEVVSGIVEQIMANEEPANWLSSIQVYGENPEDKNHLRVKTVNNIAVEHQLDNFLASLLLASKVDDGS